MIDTVLVACDFSSAAARALAHGVDVAARMGGRLYLLHVHEVPADPFAHGPPSVEAQGATLQQPFRERCRNILAPYGRAPSDDDVSCLLHEGRAAAPAIVHCAEANDVDLLALGTHGRRGVRRLLLGSVAEEVLRTAPCPVLTTRAHEARPRTDALQRLVVPVDFSEASREALRFAAGLALVYGLPLTLVHVVDLPTLPTLYNLEVSGRSPDEIEARVHAELEMWGRSVAAVEQEVSVLVETGDPVSVLLDCAAAPTDLLVMATHGLSGVKRRVLGSVAEGILRRAAGPVISGRTFPEP
jgi:nucleotide-binding universal stress UspA family protein